jgi:hypothetical protein
MWSEDDNLRSLAREIIAAIGNHWGGDPRIAQVARTKWTNHENFVTVFCRRIAQEIREDVEGGLHLWFNITRLLRDKVPFFVEEGMENWLQIALVRARVVVVDVSIRLCYLISGSRVPWPLHISFNIAVN